MNVRALLFRFLIAALAFPALAQEPAKCKLVRIAEWPIRLQGGHPILEEALKLDPQHQGALRGRDSCRGGADAKKGT